nr:ankyrin repeat domain-containing protein [Pectobacterium colocasium]
MFGSTSKTDTLETICFSDAPTSKKRKLIDRYLAAKGDINALSDGQTVLHQLSQDRDTEIDLVRYLLEKGANIETPEGESALFAAITSYSPELAALLLQHGARLDFQDNQGRGWLHCFFDLPESPVYTHAQRSTMLGVLPGKRVGYQSANPVSPRGREMPPGRCSAGKAGSFLVNAAVPGR